MKSGIKSLAACLAVVAVLGMASESFGQVVPFNGKGKGAEYTPDPLGGFGPYAGTGNVLHMGKANLSGSVRFAGEPDPATLIAPVEFGTNLVATDMSGNEIYFAVNGSPTVQLFPVGDLTGDITIDEFTAKWTVEMVVTGGSGRFEGVSSKGAGTLEVSAVNEPFRLIDPVLVYSWTINGKINLGKKGKK